MPIEHRPLTPAEMLNAERLLLGLDSVSAALMRWNDLARTLGIPPIAIRFSGAPARIYGEIEASCMVQGLILDNRLRQLQAHERKAA